MSPNIVLIPNQHHIQSMRQRAEENIRQFDVIVVDANGNPVPEDVFLDKLFEAEATEVPPGTSRVVLLMMATSFVFVTGTMVLMMVLMLMR